MLSITDRQGNADQTTVRYHLTSVKMAIIQKENKINVGQHMENWNSFTLLVLPLWKKIWLLLFSCSVVSDSLLPHGLQHARLPCPLPTSGACSNSCPLSWWCHPTILCSVGPFSSRLQSFPASRSFLMSQLFTSGGQSIGVSISSSSEYSGLISFRIDWFDLFAVQRTLKSLLQRHSSKASILRYSVAFFMVRLLCPYMTSGES